MLFLELPVRVENLFSILFSNRPHSVKKRLCSFSAPNNIKLSSNLSHEHLDTSFKKDLRFAPFEDSSIFRTFLDVVTQPLLPKKMSSSVPYIDDRFTCKAAG